jgi:hypothetical protein
MNPVTKSEYLAALDIIKRYRNQKGKMPVVQWLTENPGISVRLFTVLKSASTIPGFQFIEDLTEAKFFMLKNACRRSWEEFNETKEPNHAN